LLISEIIVDIKNVHAFLISGNRYVNINNNVITDIKKLNYWYQ